MKQLLSILLILLIIATFSICAIKPELHKNVIVYDSAYTLVPEEEVITEAKNISVMEMPSKPIEKTTIDVKNVGQALLDKNLIHQTTKVETKITPKQITTVKQTVSKPNTKRTAKPVTTAVQKTVAKKEIPEVVQNPTTQSLPSRVKEDSIKQMFSLQSSPSKDKKVTATPNVMTQQEETIAWNKWRSALTNKIMQDTKLPDIPNGTVFQFSFNVDKYGKITNVQTGANPANYTPHAIQYIAPVIRSYQGKSILNFPDGTARTFTQVTGKWRISNTEKYSTPQDYNDIEKVLR